MDRSCFYAAEVFICNSFKGNISPFEKGTLNIKCDALYKLRNVNALKLVVPHTGEFKSLIYDIPYPFGIFEYFISVGFGFGVFHCHDVRIDHNGVQRVFYFMAYGCGECSHSHESIVMEHVFMHRADSAERLAERVDHVVKQNGHAPEFII